MRVKVFCLIAPSLMPAVCAPQMVSLMNMPSNSSAAIAARIQDFVPAGDLDPITSFLVRPPTRSINLTTNPGLTRLFCSPSEPGPTSSHRRDPTAPAPSPEIRSKTSSALPGA